MPRSGSLQKDMSCQIATLSGRRQDKTPSSWCHPIAWVPVLPQAQLACCKAFPLSSSTLCSSLQEDYAVLQMWPFILEKVEAATEGMQKVAVGGVVNVAEAMQRLTAGQAAAAVDICGISLQELLHEMCWSPLVHTMAWACST